MTFGTRYQDIEELVAILQQHLQIVMEFDDDGESGISYDWSHPPDEQGFAWHGIGVQPVWTFDPEEGTTQPRNRYWAEYTFVVSASHEADVSRIRDLIQRGVLTAEEIPEQRARRQCDWSCPVEH